MIFSFFDSSAEYKNLIGIISGLIFIAWGRPIGVLIICLSFVIDWLLGLAVGALRKKNRAGALCCLVLDMLFNIFIFIVYTRGDASLLPAKLTLKSTMIPFAMGYYVLRAFSYVYDVYKGEEAEKNPFCLLTYMVSYHFMMCGPVIRYKDIRAQIRERHIDGRMLSRGFDDVVIGLSKAVLLGHALHNAVIAGLEGADVTLFGCWLGMAAFFGEAYFTLSGFCQMSRGFGLMNGFEYKTNFADIDSSKGFTGLVKGYNTSVTGFFEEAVFEPFKDKKVIAEIMAFVSCMLVALWYSFSKPAIIAGAAAGAVIVIERLFLRERIKKLPAAVRYIYLVLLSMLIFGAVYFGNVYGWRKWALGLIGVGDKYFISKELRKVILSHLFIFIAGIVYIIPSLRKFVAGRVEKFEEESARAYTFVESCKTVLKALMLVMCITGIIVGKL